MKQLILSRLVPCVLIAAGVPLLGHCGGTAEPGTETGNPPAVEQQKLHVVLRGTGVEVIGDPGAVSPGASVTVVNRTTGDAAGAIARADGSVSVTVPGSAEDEYEVTVSNGNGTATVRISAASSSGNGGTGGTGDGSTLSSASCTELENSLRQSVASGIDAADKSCESADDCVFAPINFGCHFQCGSAVIAEAGLAAARTAIEGDIAPLCSELESRCEPAPRLPCPTVDPLGPLECLDGVCSLPRTIGELSCEELVAEAGERASELARQAPRACQADADCGWVVSSPRCTTNCGDAYASVQASAVEQLGAAFREIEETWCGEAENRECIIGFPELPCPPPVTPSARCASGQCEVVNLSPL